MFVLLRNYSEDTSGECCIDVSEAWLEEFNGFAHSIIFTSTLGTEVRFCDQDEEQVRNAYEYFIQEAKRGTRLIVIDGKAKYNNEICSCYANQTEKRR